MAHELQNFVLHYRTITIMTAQPSNHERHAFQIMAKSNHGVSQIIV